MTGRRKVIVVVIDEEFDNVRHAHDTAQEL